MDRSVSLQRIFSIQNQISSRQTYRQTNRHALNNLLGRGNIIVACLRMYSEASDLKSSIFGVITVFYYSTDILNEWEIKDTIQGLKIQRQMNYTLQIGMITL